MRIKQIEIKGLFGMFKDTNRGNSYNKIIDLI